MAVQKPIKHSSGRIQEFASGDTIPVSNIPVMVGDSGSGGTAGAAPAPSAGAANKFLAGDGTYKDVNVSSILAKSLILNS